MNILLRIQNPGYRIYHVDITDGPGYGDVTDHETWIYNLEKANEAANIAIASGENNSSLLDIFNVPWFQLYRATEVYKIPNLLPNNLKKFVIRMAKDRNTFDTFYR